MKNVITGSLKINVAGLQSDKDGKSSVVHVSFFRNQLLNQLENPSRSRILFHDSRIGNKTYSGQGHELDIPYIEDASENKPFKVRSKMKIS